MNLSPLPRLAAALSYLLPATLAAQASPTTPVDTTGLAAGPYSTMEMLYERTVFNVDVFSLELTFGPETADTLQALMAGREMDDARRDSLARAAASSRNVLVRTRFHRDVGLDRFLDGLRESLDHARAAGYLTPEEVARIDADTEAQYGPLRERGIRAGEQMWYRIRGDSLHVVYEAADGRVLVEERAVGPERRLAVLGGYLAEGTDFREPLVRSLFRP